MMRLVDHDKISMRILVEAPHQRLNRRHLNAASLRGAPGHNHAMIDIHLMERAADLVTNLLPMSEDDDGFAFKHRRLCRSAEDKTFATPCGQHVEQAPISAAISVRNLYQRVSLIVAFLKLHRRRSPARCSREVIR